MDLSFNNCTNVNNTILSKVIANIDEDISWCSRGLSIVRKLRRRGTLWTNFLTFRGRLFAKHLVENNWWSMGIPGLSME